MKKVFGIAAMLLALAACNKIETEIQTTDQAEGITITAQLAPKTGGATTRAVSDGGNMIISEWAENEHIAILYWVGSTKKVADATVTGVDGSGAATITFTVEAGTPDNTACTLVYPYSAAMVDYTTLLAAQDGTLNANLDVRVGAGTIQTTTPGLTVSTQPEAQFAIFKFTLQDLSAGAKSATEFKVSDGSGNVMTTVTPGSASGVLYVALPVMADGTYWFNATIDSKPYIAKATTAAATVAGKYYQTTVKMATIGDVILDNGKFAARSSDTGTERAMIAYLGSETDHATYKHGLALALSDEGSMNWTTATGASGAAAHTPAAPTTTSSWQLPSRDQWNKMIDACKNVLGTKNDYQDLKGGFSGITGASNLQSSDYWSSTEYDSDSSHAWYCSFSNGTRSHVGKNFNFRVRACLAF